MKCYMLKKVPNYVITLLRFGICCIGCISLTPRSWGVSYGDLALKLGRKTKCNNFKGESCDWPPFWHGNYCISSMPRSLGVCDRGLAL